MNDECGTMKGEADGVPPLSARFRPRTGEPIRWRIGCGDRPNEEVRATEETAVNHPDYSRIAESYDGARPLSKRNAELWLNLIERFVPPGRTKLLDLGCGTGRFALPIASRLKVQVTGADSSEAMLARAERRTAPAWCDGIFRMPRN